jgi:autotransporter-associated beta strand protein
MAAAASSATAGHVKAASFNWIGTGGSGDWSDSSKWTGGAVPVSDPATILTINAPKNTAFSSNNDLADPFVCNALVVRASAGASLSLTGGALQLTNNGTNAPIIIIQYGATTTSTVFNLDWILANTTTLSTNGTNGYALDNALTGPGGLITLGSPILNNPSNTFQGGLLVQQSTLTVGPNGSLGTGTVRVQAMSGQAARLILPDAAHVTSGDASITVASANYVQFATLDQAAVNRLAPGSQGSILLGPDTVVNGTLDLSQLPAVRLGTALPGDGAVYTLSADIIPGRNTYRFGAQTIGNSDFRFADTLDVASLLQDDPTTSAARSVNIGTSGSLTGGKVRLSNGSNSYTGGTVVESNQYLGTRNYLMFDFTPAPGETPLGTGPLTVFDGLMFNGDNGTLGALPNEIIFKPGSQLVFDNVAGTNPFRSAFANRWPDSKPIALNGTDLLLRVLGGPLTEKAGALSFDGRSSITLDNFGVSNPTTTTAEFDSLTRFNHGTLELYSNQSSQFGTVNLVKIDGGGTSNFVDAVTGMVSPFVICDQPGTFGINACFLRIDATGVFRQYPLASSFDPNGDTEVVGPGSPVTISNDESCWALLATGQTTIASGKTLNVRSGGIIFAGLGAFNVSGGTLGFSNRGTPAEALLYCRSDVTITSSISSANGVTKFGTGSLSLAGANSFSGGLYVNDGTLELRNPAALPAGNPLRIEIQATLNLNGNSITVPSLTGSGTLTPGTASATLTIANDADVEFSGRLLDTPTSGRILSLTKTGAGTLILSGTNPLTSVTFTGFVNPFGGYAGLTSVQQGTLVLSEHFTRYGSYTTASGATIRFNTDHDIGVLSGNGDTAVSQNVTINADNIGQQSLAIADGATVSIRSGTSRSANNVNALTLTGSATLNLANHSLLTNTAPDTIKSYLASAYGPNQDWSAPGLTSSVAAANPTKYSLAYASGSDQSAQDAGIPVAPGQTLVQATLTGDANLDGTVDFFDITQLLGYKYNTGQPASYTDGDLNYDGVVDFFDLSLLLSANYNTGEAYQGAALAPAASAAATSAAPEPTGASFLALTAAGLLTRRHRRRLLRLK